MHITRNGPSGGPASQLWRWWALAAVGIAAVFGFTVVAPRLADTQAVPAAQAGETGHPEPLPALEREAGPVLEPGQAIEELEPGAAKVGEDGRTYGLLPDMNIPSGSDPARIAPDFIAITGRDGTTIAGYVKRDDLYPPDGRAGITEETPSVPAYAADGATVVGAMYLDKGFIALDEDPATVPGYPTLEQLQSAVADDGTN